MKCRRFFFLLFLVPNLIYGLDQAQCVNIRNQVAPECKRFIECIEQYKQQGPNDAERAAEILKESVECCKRAISYCDTILNDIARQSKSKRKERWRVQLKSVCEQDKNNLTAEINAIQPLIQQIEGNIAFNKARAVYQKSVEKTNAAHAKDRSYKRSLNNIDEVVLVLNEVSTSYEDAASIARQALALVAPYPSQAHNQETLRQVIESYQNQSEKYKKEAIDWQASVAAQKSALKEKIAYLKDESHLLAEKGLKRSCCELQKQMLPLLEQLAECRADEEVVGFKEEIEGLKGAIAAFEKQADTSRLTKSALLLSPEEFKAREALRRKIFFNDAPFLKPTAIIQAISPNKPYPFAIPLDGQSGKAGKEFDLYTEQFYRFLIKGEGLVSHLLAKVLQKGEVVHEEKIPLPVKNTMGWDRYLTTDGMIFIPETKLKDSFGIDLRLNFLCDPKYSVSMIIAQKGIEPGYQLSLSLEDGAPLYQCHFSQPPPWQLGALRKPALPNATKPIAKTPSAFPVSDKKEGSKQPFPVEVMTFPVLDLLVEELKGDPLLLAQYVYHEIDLVDPFLRQENGVFQAPGIHRDPGTTYLEKGGSPWEQCQLLVYLLRKAGYQASYVMGDPCALPKAFVEKMLFTSLPDEQEEALVQYPWVIFSDGKERVSLFPWMKEIQIVEGYDLYNFMPAEYASADRWILRYLKGDEQILKHIGPDGNDTAAVLFTRFAEEELRKQGLSLADVGIHRTPIKKQFASWADFPRPAVNGKHQIFDCLSDVPEVFAFAIIEICSHENPQKHIKHTLHLANFNCSTVPIRFDSLQNHNLRLYVQPIGEPQEHYVNLDDTDQLIDIKVSYSVPIGSESFHAIKSLSIIKGTSAALCFHFGGSSPKKTSHFYEKFSTEKDEKKRLLNLLSFVGASYFEKCGHAEEVLARLHKVIPRTVFAFGLAKLSPDTSKGDEDCTLPQVDMFWFRSQPAPNPHPVVWNQETITAHMQFLTLATVDSSSNEHQILREIFKDPYAISTVKLLQLAHLQQQKKGLEKEGFLVFTPSTFETAETTPEAAQSLYFSHLKDLNLRETKETGRAQWEASKSLFNSQQPFNSWAYAYMTPCLTLSQNGTYKEMGTLILHPSTQYALISSNNLILHGGLGSPLPRSYFTPSAIRQWRLVPTTSSYTLHLPLQSTPSLTDTPLVDSNPIPGTKKWISDVRLWFKNASNTVSDPIDTVTGAFYIDEADLILPGPFSLSIRRNYNSQNSLIGDLGCGWKLSLNPFLVDQDGKRFAAELDGTVIVYSYNEQSDRWEVLPENNPELSNFNLQGIGSSANPFHSYIENDVLYGADGSKRFYENDLLQKWVDARGNTIWFFYKDNRLSRIESSNGDFCGVHYNHEGYISEIYAKDGRRIYYSYDFQGNLVTVTLPNTAEIRYEYDRNHRVIRETKPCGKVLENVYDDEGRVKEQRSPMGCAQEMIATATFEYADGKTIVTDGEGGKTTYQIYDKQIYKITDPLGFTTLQAWFIDQKSWFDPETESIIEWNEKGGAIRSLKSTTDKRGLTTSYFYDMQGNPEIILLEGEDLTGSGESKVTKKLAYNERNLCIEEEVYGQKTLTTYDSIFPYLPKRIEKYSGNTLTSYIDLVYNSLGQLEKEDHSGSITIWNYNARGLPCKKIQITGSEDPDVVTTYAYNYQGQCKEIISVDGRQENDYNLMGNPIASKIFSPTGELISATYIEYDLNNAPRWKQTANIENTIYFDYNASGLIKAKRQVLTPSHSIAYTLYEYSPCGYLIEETDPRGYVTYRELDPLGRVKRETKEGHEVHFTYEPGGLLETITSPSGAQITRHYTTNGLLKEEIYPDGTKNTTVYDVLGRPFLETKNDIAWEINYDDANHRIVRTHLKTGNSEISEFDARGNLIRFTDAAGYISEKTYDGLNRLKSETTPSGKQTLWNYQNDIVICTFPSGETITTQYAGGQATKSEVTNSEGTLIAVSQFHYDPENDREEVIKGDERTVTWRNTLGLPIKIEKGTFTTAYEYDACGNCIVSIDGDGRVTRQEFDGLGRVEKKELPDGSRIGFVYDLDSNLTEYHLPNGNVWTASYDSMQRKTAEELFSSTGSSGRWTFSYEDGYLARATDPMQRTHAYLYDPYGRLLQDIVEGGKRVYTYDARGLLVTADQTMEIPASWLLSWVYRSQSEHSLVERSYDADGNLTLESTYLNSTLIQQTHQKWTANSRSLQIGNHTRDFTYQNNQLVEVSTPDVGMTYSYDLRGALKSKNNPLSSTTIDYNASGLPETIVTRLPERSYQEQLYWHPSGKLYRYTAPARAQNFSYNERGYLKLTGSEKYDFDFGSVGIGVRTAAPGWYVPQNGLDEFGKILASVSEERSLSTEYNAMGEVISYGQKQLFWDPWGRLIKVNEPSLSWEASYDAFGRRLQTRYTKSGERTLVTNSFYDPEEEFEEIGVQIGGKTFWKIYGPDACDVVTDETGAYVTLMHNALRQLIGVVSHQGILYSEKLPSAYGPLETTPAIASDLISYTQSLSWHSKAQDPTGLIWMGKRYYDSRNGQFLSQDPVSYPMCLDLYAYANGDPINYFDPDGRFASPVYRIVEPVLISAFQPDKGLKQARGELNGFAAYLANNGLTRSSTYEVGSFDLIHGAIGFINGINNTLAESIACAQQLSEYAGGAKVYGIYNATNWDSSRAVSTMIDVIECTLAHLGIHTPPVQLLKNQWRHFIETHGPNDKFLQISHSGGAIHVFNALMTSSKSVQQRIISAAFAPGAIIPKKLCFESYNYKSKRDFVTNLDAVGMIKYRDQLQVLEPHPDADDLDHGFLSPTFESPKRDHIQDFNRKYGGIQ